MNMSNCLCLLKQKDPQPNILPIKHLIPLYLFLIAQARKAKMSSYIPHFDICPRVLYSTSQIPTNYSIYFGYYLYYQHQHFFFRILNSFLSASSPTYLSKFQLIPNFCYTNLIIFSPLNGFPVHSGHTS